MIIKTKVQTSEPIEARDYTIIEYCCDSPNCTFIATTEEQWEVHYAKVHSISKKAYADNCDFVYFADQQAIYLWCKHFRQVDSANQLSITSEVSGWYRRSDYSSPCPRGCCTDRWIRLDTLDECEKELTTKLKEQIDGIRKVRQLRKGS